LADNSSHQAFFFANIKGLILLELKRIAKAMSRSLILSKFAQSFVDKIVVLIGVNFMAQDIGKTRIEYSEMLVDWLKIEPLMNGASAVRSQIRSYLNRVYTTESDAFYLLRSEFLSFTPIYRHFVRLSAAIISRKPIRIEGVTTTAEPSEEWQKIFLNVDLKGNRLDVFVNRMLECLFAYGRAGILVDSPDVPAPLPSKAAQIGLRPWWIAVRPFDLPYWRHIQINGDQVLVHARFKSTELQQDEEGNDRLVDRRRVYDLIDGRCVCSIHDLIEGKWTITKEILINLPYIPYFEPQAFNGYGAEMLVSTPPLLDLAALNITHTNLCTNLDYSLNTNAIPRLKRWQETSDQMPVNPRYDQNAVDSRPSIDASPEKIIDLPMGYNVDFLAPPSNVHADIADRIKNLEEKAAKYWLTTIATQKAGAETESSKILDREQGNSVLAVTAICLEDCLNNALMATRDMMDINAIGKPLDHVIRVNRKFELGQLSVEMGRLLSDMQTLGQISEEQLLAEIIDGGLLTVG
jgi:hypothetical protein